MHLAGLQVAVLQWVAWPVYLETSAGWLCAILSPRDYSDLKRLRCLLNVQSSKQQVVFSKNVCVLIKERSHVSEGIHLQPYEGNMFSFFVLPHVFPCFIWLVLSYLVQALSRLGTHSSCILSLSCRHPALFYTYCHVSRLAKLLLISQ
jgi:hypothetical protein